MTYDFFPLVIYSWRMPYPPLLWRKKVLTMGSRNRCPRPPEPLDSITRKQRPSAAADRLTHFDPTDFAIFFDFFFNMLFNPTFVHTPMPVYFDLNWFWNYLRTDKGAVGLLIWYKFRRSSFQSFCVCLTWLSRRGYELLVGVTIIKRLTVADSNEASFIYHLPGGRTTAATLKHKPQHVIFHTNINATALTHLETRN